MPFQDGLRSDQFGLGSRCEPQVVLFEDLTRSDNDGSLISSFFKGSSSVVVSKGAGESLRAFIQRVTGIIESLGVRGAFELFGLFMVSK